MQFPVAQVLIKFHNPLHQGEHYIIGTTSCNGTVAQVVTLNDYFFDQIAQVVVMIAWF